MNVFPTEFSRWWREFLDGAGQLLVLTGAGISAESGIPTFRGPEGYWRVGSRDYMPEEMATWEMFCRRPAEVWAWYLFRRGVCLDAQPNAAHLALVQLEKQLGQRFTLITQNVDGLHLRAGNSLERTLQIHGNIHFARCADECGRAKTPLPTLINKKQRDEPLTEEERRLLHCACGSWLRPHVLWFDECYDQENYHLHSAQRAAGVADCLLVIGTSGATNLPSQIGAAAAIRKIKIIDINLEDNPFSQFGQQAGANWSLRGTACELVPLLAGT